MKKKYNKWISLGLGTVVATSTVLGVPALAYDDDIDVQIPPYGITTETTTKKTETTTKKAETTTKRAETTTKVVTTERTTEATTEKRTKQTTKQVTTERTTETPVRERTTEATTKVVLIEPLVTEITTKEVETEQTTKEVTTQATTKEATTEATTAAVATVTEPTTAVTTEITTAVATTTTTAPTTAEVKRPDIKEYNITIKRDEALSLERYLRTGQTAKQFMWNTSDSKIVSVDNSGSIYGVRTGGTTVTAYSEQYIYLFHVIVNISDNTAERNLTIYNGDDCDLSRYVQHDARDYNWTCSNTSRAKVDRYGTFVTKASGYVEVTATYSYTTSSSDVTKYTFKITIKDKPSGGKGTITRYYDNKATILVPTGETVNLSDFLTKQPSSYSWSTNNAGIATINRNTGKVLGNKAGTTMIYAEGPNAYAFSIRVSDKFDSCSKELKVGETFDITRYLTKDISNYNITTYNNNVAYNNSVIKYSKGIVTGNNTGVSYVICDSNFESVQIIVKVSGAVSNTTTSKTVTNNATINKNTQTSNSSNSNNNSNTEVKKEENKVTQAIDNSVTYTTPSFNDISERAWAVPAIEKMASKGFIVGRAGGKFAPDDKCSRADFTIVLTKILGVDGEIPDTSSYSDVESDAYFSNYIGIAKKLGIIAGERNNSYFPKNNITREEVMAMVYKALAYKGVSMDTDVSILNSYLDANQIAPEYKEAVAGLLSINAINGTSENTLDPKESITRAQMAVIMNNCYGKID